MLRSDLSSAEMIVNVHYSLLNVKLRLSDLLCLWSLRVKLKLLNHLCDQSVVSHVLQLQSSHVSFLCFLILYFRLPLKLYESVNELVFSVFVLFFNALSNLLMSINKPILVSMMIIVDFSNSSINLY